MTTPATSLLTTRGLTVGYSRGRGKPPFVAVEGVDLDIAAGETVGIVGESGSGKSTFGNAILGVVRPTAGRIVFEGEDITHAGAARRRALTQHIQVVFQDPFGSLNPMRTIGKTLEEPLLAHQKLGRKERADKVGEALVRVGLTAADADRYPGGFSGGQRQRIAIARALLLEPKLIICDEAVSALDLSVQAQILNLLRSLQQELNIALLFISHDMAVVRHVSDRVVVLYAGKVMESGSAAEICDDPQHPYTQRLLAARPVPDPVEQRNRRQAGAPAVTAPVPTAGCPFRPQCPLATDICADDPPVRRRDSRTVSCHAFPASGGDSPAGRDPGTTVAADVG
ncbi:oligopeptide/dipeptide ABC transporter ATP-binding protein [Amycolatopsis sp.]|jgi:peptide/nickel transport system ATP-binding protein|uniref:ABC transporter ATP-binding protein n=1 Tax=Amycolatopsis sp. TaxID=37632 RepID=UPI002E09709D|nr:oligopeptide/dipeptide ABC transporter ATP-binding protein [Amycolatopsis sp.]